MRENAVDRRRKLPPKVRAQADRLLAAAELRRKRRAPAGTEAAEEEGREEGAPTGRPVGGGARDKDSRAGSQLLAAARRVAERTRGRPPRSTRIATA